MKLIKTKCSKNLSINEKINIKSYYNNSEDRNFRPYQMTFGFLDIWNWNLKPYQKWK